MTEEAKKIKGVADIVFLIDATGSMGTCIDALKANISIFVDSLSGHNANNASPIKDWRAKVVGYRDFEEDETPFVDNPFVKDAAALKAQLGGLEATGGGDEPESLLDAMYKVVNMDCTDDISGTEDPSKWRHRHQARRVVIIFTDATFKESMKEPAGGTFNDLANLIYQNRVIVNLFAPDLPIYPDTFASLDKAEYVNVTTSPGQSPQAALAAFTADQSNFRKVMEQLAKTVSASAIVDPVEL
ncbi:MAG: vWA domain-containing protein [Verrucomicrobiota bacterium]